MSGYGGYGSGSYNRMPQPPAPVHHHGLGPVSASTAGGMPMPHMPVPQAGMGYGYAATSYSPNPARRTVDNEMDRDMDSLLRDLNGLVQRATAEELEQILSNEDRINSFIGDSEKIKQLQTNREKLIDSNKDRAMFNMSLEPDLEVGKEKLTEAVLKQTSLKQEYDQLRTRLEELSSQFSMDTTMALLQAAMSEKEGITEAMSEKFINNEISVEQFLDPYLSERKTYHERRIKAEKMTDLARRGQFQQQGQNYYPTGYGRY